MGRGGDASDAVGTEEGIAKRVYEVLNTPSVAYKETFEKYLLNIYQGSCKIRMSELKTNEVAILGAAALPKMKSEK